MRDIIMVTYIIWCDTQTIHFSSTKSYRIQCSCYALASHHVQADKNINNIIIIFYYYIIEPIRIILFILHKVHNKCQG